MAAALPLAVACTLLFLLDSITASGTAVLGVLTGAVLFDAPSAMNREHRRALRVLALTQLMALDNHAVYVGTKDREWFMPKLELECFMR